MSSTRRIKGEVVLPAEADSAKAVRITIELRDVSAQDQPAPLLASTALNDVDIRAHQRIPFSFDAPATAANRSLAMRVQVDMTPDQRHAAGDYLSTVSVPVAPSGDVDKVVVPVTRL